MTSSSRRQFLARLPDDVYASLEAAAAVTSSSMNDVVCSAIATYASAVTGSADPAAVLDKARFNAYTSASNPYQNAIDRLSGD